MTTTKALSSTMTTHAEFTTKITNQDQTDKTASKLLNSNQTIKSLKKMTARPKDNKNPLHTPIIANMITTTNTIKPRSQTLMMIKTSLVGKTLKEKDLLDIWTCSVLWSTISWMAWLWELPFQLAINQYLCQFLWQLSLMKFLVKWVMWQSWWPILSTQSKLFFAMDSLTWYPWWEFLLVWPFLMWTIWQRIMWWYLWQETSFSLQRTFGRICLRTVDFWRTSLSLLGSEWELQQCTWYCCWSKTKPDMNTEKGGKIR